MIRRRQFITLLGGMAATRPLAARAQQPMIGLLSGSSPGAIPHLLAAFDLGLGEQGFLIGRDMTIEYHWAHGRFDRLPAMAAELVRRQVKLIVTLGPPAGVAAKAATGPRDIDLSRLITPQATAVYASSPLSPVAT